MIKSTIANNVIKNAQNIIDNIANNTDKEQSKTILENLITYSIQEVNNLKEEHDKYSLKDDYNEYLMLELEKKRLEHSYYSNYYAKNYPENNIIEWEKDTLNNLYSIGEAQSQQEFAYKRSLGFGGSDIKKTFQKIHDNKIINLVYSKLIPKIDVTEQHSGPLYRGHLLEPFIINEFAKKVHKDNKTVIITKKSWRSGQHPSVLVNVDGLLSSDGGKTIDALIECKTSTRPEEWANNTSPITYEFQMNYYLHALDVKKAYMLALIDGDLKVIEFYRQDVLHGVNFLEMIEKLDEVQEKIIKARELVSLGMSPMKAAEMVCGLKEIAPTRESIAKHNAIFGTNLKAEELLGYNPFESGKRFVALDFETSGYSPSQGAKVIQAAYIIIDNGHIVGHGNYYFGLSQLEILNGGVESDVHRIQEKEIVDKVRFSHSQTRDLLYDEFVNKGSILIAHNATFEKQFLESVGIVFNKDNQILDTRYWLRSYDYTSNGIDSLESVCSRHDINYDGAHDAMFDTVIMVIAIIKAAQQPDYFGDTIYNII